MSEVYESNPLPTGYHDKVTANIVDTVDWSDKRLARIVRLRLLSDPGFPMWDVSYCHGQLKDGTYVRVELPFDQLPKRAVSKTILEHARRERVFAKGLGIFDAISTLN